MILRDLSQAVGDLGLVLFLTLVLLLALSMSGWWLKRRALKIQIKAERIGRHDSNTNSQEQATQLSYRASFWEGISTELFGAVITTLAFGVVVLIFQQYQSIQNRKAELILQMGSPDNGFAIEAVRQLKVLGWLQDGSLQGADLGGADLYGADLSDANLRGANLWAANLENATLWRANLQGASLEFANLSGANLWAVNLEGASFLATDFSEQTLLPNALDPFGFEHWIDGYYWTPETDMTRYTHP